ncbi:DUF5682 family protein, partial [Streptomyces sp. NPDC006510]|uniref:DUF5682 family protein n=1 Tax=Streptomyces sp. NPDC006510 TaxID=3155600 RepID=UPI0033BB3DD5
MAVDALAASRAPYLLGVRHHSPALAAVVPALLEEARAEVVCVELPTDFQPWLEHLADPETVTPVALAGAGEGGRLSFYPFADFSPELAAVRWARSRGVEVVCCDLPLGDPRWSAGALGPVRERDGSEAVRPEADAPLGATGALDAGPDASPDPARGDGATRVRRSYAEALAAAGTGRDGDDLWDRAVEVLAPGCAPDAVRRAALGVGWALRADAAVPAADLAREERMRQVIASASADGRRVAAVIGAFHAPALLASTEADAGAEAGAGTAGASGATGRAAVPSEAAPRGAGPRTWGSGTDAGGVWAAGRAGEDGAAATEGSAVTSLVPYSFDLLDSRSGYPAGIRDPLWQQAVLTAAGDPERIREAAADAVTGLCREMRRGGHTAGTGEGAETLRLACDLAALRGLPAPGRGELLEAVTTVLGQGEPLGRGRALARALEAVFVGTARGRISPHAPRSGLGPSVEAELAELRLPRPDDPDRRDLRLDPLRSPLDGRREVLLQRLLVIGASYGEPLDVASTGDSTALGTRWRLTWTPSVPARLDLAGVRGVTAAQATAGTLA